MGPWAQLINRPPVKFATGNYFCLNTLNMLHQSFSCFPSARLLHNPHLYNIIYALLEHVSPFIIRYSFILLRRVDWFCNFWCREIPAAAARNQAKFSLGLLQVLDYRLTRGNIEKNRVAVGTEWAAVPAQFAGLEF